MTFAHIIGSVFQDPFVLDLQKETALTLAFVCKIPAPQGSSASRQSFMFNKAFTWLNSQFGTNLAIKMINASHDEYDLMELSMDSVGITKLLETQK